MMFIVRVGIVIGIFILGLPNLHGQFNPYAPYSPPHARMRREYRERAVAYVGPVAREFVESMGEDAVAAIYACSPHAGRQLALFHLSGGLAKLPRPREFLRVVGQPNHGDAVAVWAVENGARLVNRDHFDAYLMSPLEYALALKDLDAGAAEVQANRHRTFAPQPGVPSVAGIDGRWVALAGGLLGLIVLVIWWKRRR